MLEQDHEFGRRRVLRNALNVTAGADAGRFDVDRSSPQRYPDGAATTIDGKVAISSGDVKQISAA